MPRSIREIVFLHHTHTDIGYTHSQPAVWELHGRFIEVAMDLCEKTRNLPPEAQFKWTCECTSILDYWRQRASRKDLRRFRDCVERGQMGAGALRFHLTPLADMASLRRSLAPLDRLRKELGLPFRTAISHDVNGLPWPVTGLLLDAGIELFLMGANIIFGAHPLSRPLFFHWKGPDGRKLLTGNCEHYNALGRITNFQLGDLNRMESGLRDYLAHKLPDNWPFDFVFLTATQPYFADNNPPSLLLLEMVRRWNEEGRSPRLRYILPEELLAKLRSKRKQLPVFSGDWTDYWNFGCGSSALETKIQRHARNRLRTAALLEAIRGPGRTDTRRIRREAEEASDLWEEHTWDASASITHPYREETIGQWILKAQLAWKARSLSLLVLRDQLDAMAGTPPAHSPLAGILLCNPTPVKRSESILLPGLIKNCLPGFAQNRHSGGGPVREGESAKGRRQWDHLLSRVHQLDQLTEQTDPQSIWTKPIEVPPYSLRRIPLEELESLLSPSGGDSAVSTPGVLQNSHLELHYDPASGKIGRISRRGRKPFLEEGDWPVACIVRESPADAKSDSAYRGREVLHDFDWDKIHDDIPCWKPEWKAQREMPGKPDFIRELAKAEGPALELSWSSAIGVTQLKQTITLLNARPAVRVEVSLVLADTLTPEAYYVVFPLTLEKEWEAWFETADTPVRVDEEQLPGTCRDYLTVHRWVGLRKGGKGVVLNCPDAPLVQLGDFSFGRRREPLPRPARPLLLGWMTNNYWITNFRPHQAGPLSVQYEIAPFDSGEDAAMSSLADGAGLSLEWHPFPAPCTPAVETLLEISDPRIRVLEVRHEEEGLEWLITNVDLDTVTSTLAIPGARLLRRTKPSYRTGRPGAVRWVGGRLRLSLHGRETTVVYSQHPQFLGQTNRNSP